MRTARFKLDCRACYHVISRVVDRQYLFNEDEKERLRKLLRAMEVFSGVNILTYCFMDNHYHLLMEVPERCYVPDAEFSSRLLAIYSKEHVSSIMSVIEEYRSRAEDELAEEYKGRYTYRMYDLSEFMKTFNQKITMSYNKRHGRKGTLWEDRYTSVVVQGGGNALLAMAAYIDLNPVRAGIVKDPKEYRYCGYAEAVAGGDRARMGLVKVLSSLGGASEWRSVSRQYRRYLYEWGVQTQKKAGFSPKQVAEVLDKDGKLAMHEVLRCRVRYFSDGVAIGSRDFVDSVFEKYREQFGSRRSSGARKMRYADWGDICSLRDLRLAAVTKSI